MSEHQEQPEQQPPDVEPDELDPDGDWLPDDDEGAVIGGWYIPPEWLDRAIIIPVPEYHE